jgi:hypothetical protein
MKRLLSAHVAALALFLLGGLHAQAAPMPSSTLSFTYNFDPVAPGTHTDLPAVFADGNPGASVTFSNDTTQPASVDSSNPTTDVVATTLKVHSSASALNPDHLTTNGGFDMGLTLSATDANGVHSKTLTFHGNKLGVPGHDSFSSGSSHIGIRWGADATQTVTLGIYTFTVALNSYVAPGGPSQTISGSIGANVSVSGGSITPALVPEPSSVLLSGLGLSFLGGFAWRKRRRLAA